MPVFEHTGRNSECVGQAALQRGFNETKYSGYPDGKGTGEHGGRIGRSDGKTPDVFCVYKAGALFGGCRGGGIPQISGA